MVAWRQAARIAAWNGSAVTGVHVIDTMVALELEEAMAHSSEETLSAAAGISGGGQDGPSTGVRQRLLDDTRFQWTDFLVSAGTSVQADFKAVIDSRADGIIEATKEAGADLLVLGAVGSGAAHVGMGTVATSCVRKSPCGVLLVRESKAATPFKTVVCCVDFSDASMRALESAARLAVQDAAALHVVHVFYAPWHVLHYRSPTPETDPAFRAQYSNVLQRRLQHFGDAIGRSLADLNPIYTLIDASDHRNAIPEHLVTVGADLVVLGTRGHSNLRDFFLGSTAEKVLRDAACSVLAIRPGT